MLPLSDWDLAFILIIVGDMAAAYTLGRYHEAIRKDDHEDID